jgi:hypothetical protein
MNTHAKEMLLGTGLFLLLIAVAVAARQGLAFATTHALLDPDEIHFLNIANWVLLISSTLFYLNFIIAQGIKGVRSSWKK